MLTSTKMSRRWADLSKGELIALKYPEGFKEYDPVTGEELYIIMRKNLYGHPSAGRTFAEQRNAAGSSKRSWSDHHTRKG